MIGIQYCPKNNCAIEIYNSTIDSDESVDWEFAKCGFTKDVLVILPEVEFDLRHQFILHHYPDINGLLGDEYGDSGIIRSICLNATLVTFKTSPSDPINYLIPRSTTPISPPTAPPTIPNNTTNSKDDAPTPLQLPTTPTSTEVALSIRSEEPKVD